MRKHFLLLFLMAVLPLAGWAQGSGIDISSAEITLSSDHHEYNGDAPAITVTVKNPSTGENIPVEKITVVYFDETGENEVAATTLKNVGTYYVAARANHADFTGTTPKKQFNVTPKSLAGATIGDLDFTACRETTPAPTSATYDGVAWEPTATLTLTGYTFATGDYTVTYTNNTNANDNSGTDKTAIVFTGNGNYTGSVTKNFPIAKATLPTEIVTAAAPTAKTGLIYNAKDQSLVTAGTLNAAYGEIQYKVGSGEYSADLPTAKNANPTSGYTVTWKVTGGNNYNASAETAIEGITIAKKPIQIYVDNYEDFIYNGKAIENGTVGDEFYIKNVTVRAPGIATADAALKNDLYAKFETESYNTAATAPKDYKSGGYTMVAFAKSGSTISDNYAPVYPALGSYIIQQREVTVTALPQPTIGTLDYTGESLNASITTTITDGTTVNIEKATAESTTGVVSADYTTDPIVYENINTLFTLGVKEGVDIVEAKNYPGALVITATEAQAASNYVIKSVAGDVTVTGKAMSVFAQSFDKTYGYILADDVKDYSTSPAGKELKGTVQYKVTDENGLEQTNGTRLAAGTYTISIVPNESYAPDNYTIANDAYFDGELVIAPKEVDVTLDPVSLNTGDGLTELQKYASINDSYKAELEEGDEEKIAWTIAFTSDGTYAANLLDDSKLKTADAYNTLQTANTIAWWNNTSNTISGGWTLTIAAAAETNVNGNYIFNVTNGNIVLGGAKTLKLDFSDQMFSKIADAAKACTADANVKYNVSFGDRALANEEWHAYVLPFDIKVKDLSNAVDYAIFNVLDLTKTGAESNVNGNKYVYFKLEMNEIKANQPFLMKVYSADKDNLNDVTINSVVIKPVTATVSVNSKVEGVTEFVGLYENTLTIPVGSKDRFIATSPAGVNKWWEATNNAYTVSRLEAYLKMASGTGQARIFIEDIENGTTAIKELGVDGTAKAYNVDGWYTLNGVKLQGAPTEKGIYINNGKKVVIK